jgi:hypothetical protein
MILQIGVQLLLQIVLPVFLIAELLRTRYATRWEWLGTVGMFGLVLLFAFLTARWDGFSYYLRFVLPVAFVAASYMAYRRVGSGAPSTAEQPSWMGRAVRGALIVGLVGLNTHVLSGYIHPNAAVALAYPLKGGMYYVGGGGSNRWINNHNAFPPQNYALDILRLNALGNRALGLWPEELSRYAIYGDSIFSPCTGRIARAVDGLADQIPPSRDRENPAGNHVVVTCHNAEVLMAHMMQNSVAIQAGDVVEKGAFVGQVGNSGNTTQPHLHIHVERGGPPGEILDGRGVPATFNGRFLVRNSVFTGW